MSKQTRLNPLHCLWTSHTVLEASPSFSLFQLLRTTKRRPTSATRDVLDLNHKLSDGESDSDPTGYEKIKEKEMPLPLDGMIPSQNILATHFNALRLPLCETGASNKIPLRESI